MGRAEELTRPFDNPAERRNTEKELREIIDEHIAIAERRRI